jgi:hypothetical protein
MYAGPTGLVRGSGGSGQPGTTSAGGTGGTNVLRRQVLSTSGSVLLQSSANPSSRGRPVTSPAYITCPGYLPTGTVTFTDSSTALGTASVNGSGQASLRVAALTSGNHTMVASYGGNAHCPAEVSAPLTQTVRPSGFSLGG